MGRPLSIFFFIYGLYDLEEFLKFFLYLHELVKQVLKIYFFYYLKIPKSLDKLIHITCLSERVFLLGYLKMSNAVRQGKRMRKVTCPLYFPTRRSLWTYKALEREFLQGEEEELGIDIKIETVSILLAFETFVKYRK